ncbi:hypothetical protein EIP86_006407 [Pleurotus ostreatoroseus]|nr:hypothetical protein EIP86_006407 [Pleurotus ostreatoroseus]
MVPSLQSLCLESRATLELAPRRANPISLPALRRLQIVDHWLLHFCENVRLSWNRVQVDISRGPFITTTRRPNPSNNAPIFNCIASYLGTSFGDPETRYYLNVHVKQLYKGKAEVIMTRGRHDHGTRMETGGFTLPVYCGKLPEQTIAKHMESFFNAVPLPGTSTLDVDAALPPSLWQQLSCTHIDQLESLTLSNHAVRSFILACNNYTAAPLFPELKELQLKTGKFAIATRKDSKPYHVLRNLEAALSARKRKGLALQSLKIVYEGKLTDEELAFVRAARLAERLRITELGYAKKAQYAPAEDIPDT